MAKSEAAGKEAAAPAAAEASNNEAAAASSSPAWELHLGPFTLRNGSAPELRPQMKFGGSIGNIKAEAGFSDVRDGLKFDWGCRAWADARSTGNTLEELHVNMRQEIGSKTSQAASDASKTVSAAVQTVNPERCAGGRLGLGNSQTVDKVWEGAGQAIEAAQSLLSRTTSTAGSAAGSGLGRLAQELGCKVEDLDKILSGGAANEGSPLMHLRLIADVGVAVRAQLNLGWEDTAGYKMMGVGGSADAILSLGGQIFAGWHKSGVGMRMMLGIGNFTFEYTFPQAKKPESSKEKEPAAADSAGSAFSNAAPTNSTETLGNAAAAAPSASTEAS